MFSDPLFSKEDHIWLFGGVDGGVSWGRTGAGKRTGWGTRLKLTIEKEGFGLDTGDIRPH